MSDAEATVRHCILDGISAGWSVEQQIDLIYKELFEADGTKWAAKQLIEELGGPNE